MHNLERNQKPVIQCACGVNWGFPQIWHDTRNHLCRFHRCAKCDYAGAEKHGLIDEIERYLAMVGWGNAQTD